MFGLFLDQKAEAAAGPSIFLLHDDHPMIPRHSTGTATAHRSLREGARSVLFGGSKLSLGVLW